MTMFYEVTVTFNDGSYGLAYAGTSQRTADSEYASLCERDDVHKVSYDSQDTTYGRDKRYGTHQCVYCDTRSPIVMMRRGNNRNNCMVCIDHHACMLRIHNRYHTSVWPTDDCPYC